MEVANGRDLADDATFKAYLQAALDCVVVSDGQGRVVEFNPAAEQTFGYSREEALGKALADLIVPPSLRERHVKALATFAATRVPTILGRRLELTGMRADGSEFPIELVLSQVGGKPLLVCASIRDLSDAKRAENDLRALAAEQEALRRVATLVARGAPPAEVFDAVCVETAQLTGATHVNLAHFMPDGVNLTEAGWSLHDTHLPAGTRLSLEGGTVRDLIRQRAAPARVDDYDHVPGDLADLIRRRGIRSEIGAPVVVQGQVWGALVAGTERPEPLPASAEQRVASFAELVATAVSNTAARSELMESRARVVAAADETRRRIERDLHDGTQQRLVSLALDVRAAEASVPPQLVELKAQLSHVAEGLTGAVADLLEIARGIHPAILSRGGLGAALRTLARRSSIPVQLDLSEQAPVPERVEMALYYLVSEALTNAAKHAHASVVHVDLEADQAAVQLSVRDNGVGGARCAQGSGLLGLRDRIEALGGTFDITSPDGKGTTLLANIPLANP